MKDYELEILVLIHNVLVFAVFAVVAIIFEKWWIVLFGYLGTCSVSSTRKE